MLLGGATVGARAGDVLLADPLAVIPTLDMKIFRANPLAMQHQMASTSCVFKIQLTINATKRLVLGIKAAPAVKADSAISPNSPLAKISITSFMLGY